jgi:predicted transposase YdaD
MFKHSKVKGDLAATNIGKAQDMLDKLKMTPKERAAYDAFQFNKTINEGVLQVKFEEGERAGEMRGEERGKKIGEVIGEERGKKIGEEIGEERRAEQVAERLLKRGTPIEIVAEDTGLSVEQVEKIAQKETMS